MEYKNTVSDNPLVSVCVTTYNHAKYIEQCIDSIVTQETKFDFELLIGEDQSTDRTREICISKADKFPEIIRLQLNDRSNVIHINGKATGRANVKNLFSKARGKYIAFIEGDDFFTDKLKLQKQVDALESNPQCTVCSTSYEILRMQSGKTTPALQASEIYTFVDVLEARVSPATCTLMFKRLPEAYFPEWFDLSPFGDFVLIQIHLAHGKLITLKDITASYRIHQSGLYTGISELQRTDNMILTLNILKEHLHEINPAVKSQHFKVRTANVFYRRSYGNAILGNKKKAIGNFLSYIGEGSVNFKKIYRTCLFPLVLFKIVKIKPYA